MNKMLDRIDLELWWFRVNVRVFIRTRLARLQRPWFWVRHAACRKWAPIKVRDMAGTIYTGTLCRKCNIALIKNDPGGAAGFVELSSTEGTA